MISVKEIDITDDEVEALSLNQEIEHFNDILDSIATLPNYTKMFHTNFMQKLKDEIDILNSNCNISNYLFTVNVLKAKFNMYNYLNRELIELCQVNSVDKKTIEKVFLILNAINEKNQKVQNDIVNLIFQLSPRIDQQIAFYRKEYNDIKGDLKIIKEGMREKEKMNKVLYDNNKILQAKVNSYQNNSINNNQSNNSTINKASIDLGASSAKKENKFKSSYTFLKKETDKIPEANLKNKTISSNEESTKNIYISNINLKQTNYIPSPKLPNTEQYVLKKNRSTSNINTATISPRILTQKQLLQVITEIYTSKSQYDKKCNDYHLPKETLEQHMYTFLNNKYGLNNLTIEWATSIINGIKQYSQTNSEVCLFGKILKNELEEESYQVYLKLKSTIYELLGYYYQTKYPYKSTKEIDRMLKEKQGSYLIEEEWKTLIKYLFPKDSETVLSKINEYIESSRNERVQTDNKVNTYAYSSGNSRKLTREELKSLNRKENDLKILYTDFNKILLEIQIRLRDKYLSNFVSTFKQIDEDDDGVLNEEQFRDLIIKLELYPLESVGEEYEKLIDKIDPFNTQVFTFSDCVRLLANEFVDDGKTKALDKIAMNTVTEENVDNNNNATN